MQTQISEPARTFAERILTEMAEIKAELGILRQFANILGLPPEGQAESFMAVTMRLLSLLVSGTEETHRRLEALHATIIDPRMTQALRSAIHDA